MSLRGFSTTDLSLNDLYDRSMQFPTRALNGRTDDCRAIRAALTQIRAAQMPTLGPLGKSEETSKAKHACQAAEPKQAQQPLVARHKAKKAKHPDEAEETEAA
jgi:hypothetical protein